MADSQNIMTPAEAREFLERSTEDIEAGITIELARRILEANAIVAADDRAQREARIAAARADLAGHRCA